MLTVIHLAFSHQILKTRVEKDEREKNSNCQQNNVDYEVRLSGKVREERIGARTSRVQCHLNVTATANEEILIVSFDVEALSLAYK